MASDLDLEMIHEFIVRNKIPENNQILKIKGVWYCRGENGVRKIGTSKQRVTLVERMKK